MKDILIVIIGAFSLVGFLNWLGGEKHLWFNNARKELRTLRALFKKK